MTTLLFDDEELFFLAEAERQARALLPVDRLLSAADSGRAWCKLAELGWQRSSLPERFGGSGLSVPTLLGLARAAGAQLAVDDFVTNVYLLPSMAVTIGDAVATSRMLESLSDRPGFLLTDGRTGELLAGPMAQHPWVCGVLDGASAYALSRAGATLVLRRWDADRYDYRPFGELALGVGTVTVHGEPADTVPLDASSTDLDEWARTAQLVHAAALVGAAAEALDGSVQHAMIRRQFGRVIGEFQAVKHALATASTKIEAAWASCLYAACAGRPADVACAHILAADAVETAARTMIHTYGGMGFTWEHPAHLFLKTAMTGARRFAPEDLLRCAALGAGRS